MPSPGQVTQLLAIETGETRSSEHIAAGTATACDRLSRRLAPLVGDAGIHSLFARSLTLTQAGFPWLGAVGLTTPFASWTQLRLCIEKQPPEVATEASVALVSTFIGMLEKFIGQSLTARLLHDVWPEVFPA